MSRAASMHPALTAPRRDARGSAFGWGISLLAHALAAAWLWHAWRPHPPDTDTGPVKRIEVWLVPIAPKVPLPAQAPAPAPRVTVPRSSPTRPRAASRPAPPERSPRASVAPPAPVAITPTPPPETTPATGTHAPLVDLAAARAAARLIAREDAKGLVALPQRKPVVDPNADHHVVDPLERARRINCETARAESTNLLANVVMLASDMVKNAIDDSGCKW